MLPLWVNVEQNRLSQGLDQPAGGTLRYPEREFVSVAAAREYSGYG